MRVWGVGVVAGVVVRAAFRLGVGLGSGLELGLELELGGVRDGLTHASPSFEDIARSCVAPSQNRW